jgi:hypothetical protein
MEKCNVVSGGTKSSIFQQGWAGFEAPINANEEKCIKFIYVL